MVPVACSESPGGMGSSEELEVFAVGTLKTRRLGPNAAREAIPELLRSPAESPIWEQDELLMPVLEDDVLLFEAVEDDEETEETVEAVGATGKGKGGV
eukprot:s1087_g13.t2